jgi:hypothetical protein
MKKISEETFAAIIKEFNETETCVVDLSAKYGICTARIYRLFKENNIKLTKFKSKTSKSRKFSRLTNQIKTEIKIDYLNGMLTKEIAVKFGINNTTVNAIRKQLGLEQADRRILVNENFFENIDSIEKAWVLGFACGDSHINPKDKSFTTDLKNLDISVLEKFKKYMESEHPIYETDVFDKRTNHTYKHVILSITRHKIYNDLIKLGIGPNKSKELTLPNIPKHLMRDFIRGIFCSDGNWHINTTNSLTISIASSVKSFLEEIKIILEKECSIQNCIINSNNDNDTCFKLTSSNKKEVVKFYNYIYHDNMKDAYLDRKYNYSTQYYKNLFNNLRSRNSNDPPLDLYTFGNPQHVNLSLLCGINTLNSIKTYKSECIRSKDDEEFVNSPDYILLKGKLLK